MTATGDKLTLTVIAADVGGFIGHISSHPDVLDTAKERLHNAKEKGVITDFHVLRCGDDLGLILTHRLGCGAKAIHELSWNTLDACTETALELKLHKAGEDMTKGDRSRDNSAGPSFAEMEFVERTSEPVIVFMANKTSAGAWNLPVYKIFADPFNTAGLVQDALMFDGFTFRILDVNEGTEITLAAPRDLYSIIALASATSKYVITAVARNTDLETAAVVAARKLDRDGAASTSADNPVAIIRCQAGFPAVGEALESFTTAHLVGGWMRQAHNGPLMPVPFYEANPSRFDGPPRLIGAGFQISHGRLVGPHDMFDDPSFDETRRLANQITEYLRRHGPFEPHRLTGIKSETAALAHILERLKERPGR